MLNKRHCAMKIGQNVLFDQWRQKSRACIIMSMKADQIKPRTCDVISLRVCPEKCDRRK